ncbi:MAG: sugar phosphate isomerase/epimerase [Planctomycetes bacterium]|nr:sugar phosphate isomerase/epimerase [Planctomycetota bacterium]
MSSQPSVIISGFADEAAVTKGAVEQLSVFAALGLEYYSLRFIDLGEGVKNVMKLGPSEIRELLRLHQVYDMRVASVGSPIGKVKLLDMDDGTKNAYVPFPQYLRDDVMRAIELAHTFQTKLLRGFSFYPPRGDDVAKHLAQASDQLAAIAGRCGENGVVYGLEVEANLVGKNGRMLAEIHRRVNNPHLVLIFDAGNLTTQNMPAAEVFTEYQAMRDGIGWMHIKDYRIDSKLQWTGAVDEERLKNFVPPDEGDSGHEAILRDFRSVIPALEEKLKPLGVPGVFLDLEPHLKGGGQFGGFSGPDGMGVALRALVRLLDYTHIGYRLRDFDSIRRSRGF